MEAFKPLSSLTALLCTFNNFFTASLRRDDQKRLQESRLGQSGFLQGDKNAL